MVVLIRKYSAVLVSLIFIVTVTVLSLNLKGVELLPVTGANNGPKTVILDPGHGGEDPGAVSDYSGLKEKDVNLKIALTVKGLLETEGFKVIMTRSEDRLEYSEGTSNVVSKRIQDLTRRKKLMDESGADAVVSIHLNKFEQPKQYGAQTFYAKGSEDGRKLAESIQQALKEQLDPNNKREALVKQEPVIILKSVKVATAMVECGFLSNADEEKKLADKEYQDKLAVAIKDGIKRYFENIAAAPKN